MSLDSDWLDFLLVTGVTAVGLFILAAIVLWLTARARKTAPRRGDGRGRLLAIVAGSAVAASGRERQRASPDEPPGLKESLDGV